MFGDIVNNEIRLNEYGDIANKFWKEIPKHFQEVESDIFVIMPNHLHGIIIIGNMNDAAGAGLAPALNKNNNAININNQTVYNNRTIGINEMASANKEKAGINKERAGARPAPTGDPTENDMVL
jgi:REP element-mobilizing transposase RayT